VSQLLGPVSPHEHLQTRHPDSSAEMVLVPECAAPATNSTARTAFELAKSVVRRSKDCSMTELGELGCPRLIVRLRGEVRCILSPSMCLGFLVERVQYVISTFLHHFLLSSYSSCCLCARAATPASQFAPVFLTLFNLSGILSVIILPPTNTRHRGTFSYSPSLNSKLTSPPAVSNTLLRAYRIMPRR